MTGTDSLYNAAGDPDLQLNRKVKQALILILLLALLVRTWICFFSGLPNLHRDTTEYFSQSDALMHGSYINFFPNGYPFLITLFRFVDGEPLITCLLCVNIVMSVAVVWFVFRITQDVFRIPGLALLAALITAIFPSQINYVRWLSSEVPTAFFLAGAFYLFFRQRWFMAGLFFGLATLVRTEIFPIAFLVLILELVRRKTWKPAYVAGVAIPLLLAASYCYLKTGQFSISGHGEVNIVLATTASGSYIDWDLADRNPQIRTTGQAVKLYIDGFLAQPLQFIRRRAANAWELWGFFPSSADGSRSLASRLLIGSGNFFLLVFGLYGWWSNRRRYHAALLILPFIVITAVHIVFFAMQRYTYPVEPFLIITGSWTILQLFPGMGRWISRRSGVIAVRT